MKHLQHVRFLERCFFVTAWGIFGPIDFNMSICKMHVCAFLGSMHTGLKIAATKGVLPVESSQCYPVSMNIRVITGIF